MKSRAQVALVLAKCSDADVQDLLNGHFVVGSIPHRGDTVALPGSKKNYHAFSKVKQGFFVIRFEPETETFFYGSYAPGPSMPNAKSDNLRILAASLYGPPEISTPLGAWISSWGDRNRRMQHSITTRTGRIGHGEMLAEFAKTVKGPVVAERMPWSDKGPRPQFERAVGFSRKESDWMLIKPPRFWMARQMWETDSRLRKLGHPVVTKPISALDWAAKLSILLPGHFGQFMFMSPLAASNRDAMGDLKSGLAKFWASLTPPQKVTIMNAGLKRGTLSAKSRKLLDDAALQSILNSLPKDDFSAWFEKSPANRVRVVAKQLWWFRDENGGMGAPTKELMEDMARHSQNKSHSRYVGLNFTFKFICDKGVCETDGNVFQKLGAPAVKP